MAADDYYQQLTDRLIEQLEAGTAPWQKPWEARAREVLPYNPTTGKPYRGSNSLFLSLIGASNGLDDPRWLTFKQAQALGWPVLAGSKGVPLTVWVTHDERPMLDGAGNPVLDDQGKPRKVRVELERAIPRNFTVFHVSQMRNVPELEKTGRVYEWNPEERAERILTASGAQIFHDQNDRAFYSVQRDEIHMPGRDQFPSSSAYYGTALHELGHWTGHASRLGRELGNSFGSPEYAKEELRAELASYFLGDQLGVHHDTQRHAAYVKSWIQALRDDKAEIFRAAADAQRIVDYVIGLDRSLELEQGTQRTIQHEPVEPAATPERLRAPRREPEPGETLLNVPYKERAAAAQLGAVWAPIAKTWFIPAGVEAEPFAKWLPAEQAHAAPAPGKDAAEPARTPEQGPAAKVPSEREATKPFAQTPDEIKSIRDARRGTEPRPGDTVLAVPFDERDAAKALGAVWAGKAKVWYAPEGIDPATLNKWSPDRAQAVERSHAQQKSAVEIEAEFGNFLRGFGLQLDGLRDSKSHPVMDGEIHRVPLVNHKQGKNLAGWYRGTSDGLKPGGIAGSFVTGEEQIWQAGVEVRQDPVERARVELERAQKQEKEIAERQAGYEDAARRLGARWGYLKNEPETGKTYTNRKQVTAIGLKFDGDKEVIPVRDVNGKIWSLQTLLPEKNEHGVDKLFAKGGQKAGHFHTLGKIQPGEPIIVAEGYATAASIHMATGHATIVAFDSGNLEPVVGALKEKYPTNAMFIGADDDRFPTKLPDGTERLMNGGLEAAIAASKKHGVGVLVPVFSTDARVTDFNDLHVTEGLEEVKQQINNGIAVSVEQSRAHASEILREQLGQGAKVQEPGRDSRHTGDVVGVTRYHVAQAVGGDDGVVHQTARLDAKPTPGSVVTVQYQNGRGQVTDKALQQEKQKAIER